LKTTFISAVSLSVTIIAKVKLSSLLDVRKINSIDYVSNLPRWHLLYQTMTFCTIKFNLSTKLHFHLSFEVHSLACNTQEETKKR